LLVVFLLVNAQAKNSSDVETYSQRPDDFPEIIVVPDNAEEACYYILSNLRDDTKIRSVRFILPINPNKLSSILSESDEHFFSKHWKKLRYSLFQPEKMLTGKEWGQQGEEANKHYYGFLGYIDNHNQYVKLNYSFKRNPTSDENVKLYVSQTFFKGDSINAYLLRYMELHPEEFKEQKDK